MPAARLSAVLLLAGLALMVFASVWAPAQPELLPSGGSCQIAPCGTLEDPARWRAAWVIWLVGVISAVIGVVLAVPPWKRVRRLSVVLGVIALPFWFVVSLSIAYVVSLGTSMHGAATTLVLLVDLPVLAAVVGYVRLRFGQQVPEADPGATTATTGRT